MSAHRYEIKDAGPDVLIDGADISMRCNSPIGSAELEAMDMIEPRP